MPFGRNDTSSRYILPCWNHVPESRMYLGGGGGGREGLAAPATASLYNCLRVQIHAVARTSAWAWPTHTAAHLDMRSFLGSWVHMGTLAAALIEEGML